jgi:peptidoglycan/xylan/chitin deacetylase (PgdA/CDA1 family)
MFRVTSILPFTIFSGVLVLSVYTLAESQSRDLLQNAGDDQSAYAEVATTSDEGTSPSLAPAINVPILVYHIVRPRYADDSPAVRSLALTPETFEDELSYLDRAQYHVISFETLEDYFKKGTPLPSKPVIISFDDGWHDQFTYAFPILAAHHERATFFVFTNAIGRRGFMSWDELRVMLGGGMTIGSHSRSHPYLTKVATTSLAAEITGSKTILEEKLRVPITSFAYPFGQYSSAIVKLVQKAGYHSARGDYESGKQTADHLYELSALNAPTTLAYFEQLFPLTGFTRAWKTEKK